MSLNPRGSGRLRLSIIIETVLRTQQTLKEKKRPAGGHAVRCHTRAAGALYTVSYHQKPTCAMNVVKVNLVNGHPGNEPQPQLRGTAVPEPQCPDHNVDLLQHATTSATCTSLAQGTVHVKGGGTVCGWFARRGSFTALPVGLHGMCGPVYEQQIG